MCTSPYVVEIFLMISSSNPLFFLCKDECGISQCCSSESIKTRLKMKTVHLTTCSIFILFYAGIGNTIAQQCKKGEASYEKRYYKTVICGRNDPACQKVGTKRELKVTTLCCSGYEKVNEVCQPTCLPRCTNGTCVAPGECECFEGHSKSKISTYICEPKCETECVNAICVAPNECQCNAGYVKDKNTNRLVQGKGIKIKKNSSSHICKPFCSYDCSHGDCIAPGECKCHQGYEKVHTTCQPKCSPKCVNGKCSGPDTCECDDGFKPGPSNWYVCDPICEPGCVNSTCVDPNDCQCHEGYVKDKLKHVCQPHCSDGCSHGDCIAPGECRCHQGYEKVHSICQPYCSPSCVYGKCSGPNRCECDYGFKPNPSMSNVCEPICEQECINSTCIAPNKCQCSKGYYNVEDNRMRYICKPHCSNDCSHGDCISPEVCECHQGYEKLHSICQPMCSPKCVNGDCIRPNDCKCYDGFKPNPSSSNVCVPTCVQECINSTCIAPDKCQCSKGYYNVEDNLRHYICRPHCSNGCSNGDCIGPETCGCHPNYILSPTNSSICLPYCMAECIHGECIGFNLCKCHYGYHASLTWWNVCDPLCASCDNGQCTSPGNCSCFEGFVQEGTPSKCVPRCSMGCINGKCEGPETCVCNAGFEMNKDSNSCKPICSNDCKHGKCTAPEQCQCDTGYRNDESGCVPSCKSDCVHGLCEAPNKCSCEKGTLKSGAFHCTLKCSDYPDDDKCYHDSRFAIPSFEYTVDEAFIELSPNGSISQVPCVHLPTTATPSTVIDYSCFTHLRVEEDSAEIVCALAETTRDPSPDDETDWSASLKSSQIKTVDLILLHRTTSQLCPAHVCSNSDRTFYINRISKLSMCPLEVGEKKESDVHVSSVALYSIIAIVVASTIVLISAKCIHRKTYYTFERSNPIRDSQTAFVEEEFEEGELGPQAFEYTDISDKLEDLQ